MIIYLNLISTANVLNQCEEDNINLISSIYNTSFYLILYRLLAKHMLK